ncbi:glycosyltransferase family 2 protein [Pusillimonas minor]|uniref:Glycosyltransferase family 2 protein n=1 Tax=Pusillimonas minor TaxID=2697024 RepID=A0A842HT59_9BURK|nr:glycosyltransferase family 2 protein [Pusillimonas minor]MBC2770600.1 glycosyltransferase family 2 protein [Pusillimonas minor]
MNAPLITIGMPLFNSEATVVAAIESVLRQTLTDFELVISDNCSTDGTSEICRRYADQDARIRYTRQTDNIGASPNFRYVLEQARGRYFTWAAADDVRSLDFLEVNVHFLERNSDYVASTSPNCFEGQEHERGAWISFAICGDFEDRVMQFLDNCWQSHAIFYSVIRTSAIRKCGFLGEHFLGFDWAVDLFLTRQGLINRTSCGQLILGRKGMSNSGNPWRTFRKSLLAWPLPFYHFSFYAWRLTVGCAWRWRVKLLARLLRLNAQSAYYQLYAELFPYYLKYFRPWIKRT